MNKNRVLVTVSGGLVQGIFADRPDEIEVTVRDFDIEGSEGDCAEDGSLYASENVNENLDAEIWREYVICPYSMTNLETPIDQNPVSVDDFNKLMKKWMGKE